MDSITSWQWPKGSGLTAEEPPPVKVILLGIFLATPALEHSGTAEKGSITGIYSVLVEGDDPNDPIADAVRGILDGHIFLSRSLAQANHYPPIDILASTSRLMIDLVDQEILGLAARVKSILSLRRENEDLVNIGAYIPGSNAKLDEALSLYPRIQRFLQQGITEKVSLTDTQRELRALFAKEN